MDAETTSNAAKGRHGADALLVSALSAGASYPNAARMAGVSVSTVDRRMADPAFRERVNEARAALVDRVVGALVGASVEATETLRELFTSPGVSPHVRYLSARAILELSHTYRSGAELEARPAELEKELLGK